MAIILSTNNRSFQSNYWGQIKQYPHIHSVKNIQCLLTNIACEIFKITNANVVICNLPLRICSSINAYEKGQHWKIAFDVAAIASLLFIGPLAPIAIDCTSEAINYYLSNKKELNVDPYKVLGLSVEQVQDKNILDKRYQNLCRDLDKRIKRTPHRSLILPRLKKLRSNAERAYELLLRKHYGVSV